MVRNHLFFVVQKNEKCRKLNQNLNGHENKNVESSSKFKGHRHLSWATNDTRRGDSKVHQEHPTSKNLVQNAFSNG